MKCGECGAEMELVGVLRRRVLKVSEYIAVYVCPECLRVLLCSLGWCMSTAPTVKTEAEARSTG